MKLNKAGLGCTGLGLGLCWLRGCAGVGVALQWAGLGARLDPGLGWATPPWPLACETYHLFEGGGGMATKI